MTEEREDGTGRERPSSAADRRGRRSGPAPTSDGKGRATAVRDGRPARTSLFGRLARFMREVVAELLREAKTYEGRAIEVRNKQRAAGGA